MGRGGRLVLFLQNPGNSFLFFVGGMRFEGEGGGGAATAAAIAATVVRHIFLAATLLRFGFLVCSAAYWCGVGYSGVG